MTADANIALRPWGPGDLPVLQRANSRAMTRFLGGPETPEQLAARHAEYLDPGSGARMFRIDVDGEPVGCAGWWEEEHDSEPVYEIGCAIEVAHQGRGLATAALAEVVRLAAEQGDRRLIVGYAPVANAASNALCNRVGFELQGRGVFPSENGDLEVNIWMLGTSRSPR